MMAVMEATALSFATAARTLAAACRKRGLVVPGFRSPPRVPEAERTVRRWPDGATVSVRVRGRPFPAVVADMVEGIVVVNGLAGVEATRVRTVLWDAITEPEASPPAPATTRREVRAA
jgi:hypothetical protein